MKSPQGIWIKLKSSLWFMPAACVLLAAGLAAGCLTLDVDIGRALQDNWPQIFGLSANGARSILATIAQSVITIAGVTFSITIVALSLAANQYSPRVLRNFMRDRGNQVVLGGMIGTFTYCILVLRTVHDGEVPFVPAVSVLAALLLAVVTVGLFIFFIHHAAATIAASGIISSIAEETRATIRSLHPEPDAQAERLRQDSPAPAGPECDLSPEEERMLAGIPWQSIPSPGSGYLQAADEEQLTAFAWRHQTVLRIEHQVGEFVIQGQPLLSIGPCSTPPGQASLKLNRLFNIDSYRTIDQDVAFGVRQIVDVAVKALSPGINDPTTAVTCLHYLGCILSLLIQRLSPPRCRRVEGQLCLVMHQPSFEGLLELAFTEIRQNSGSQPVVLLAMLNTLDKVAATPHSLPGRHRLLAEQARLVLGMAEQNIRFAPDLERIRQRARLLEALIQDKLGEQQTGTPSRRT